MNGGVAPWPPRCVAVVGTGVIGTGWTALFLARGLDVVAFDPAPEAAQRLRRGVDAAWRALTRLGLSENADRKRLRFATSVADAVREADFVQESGPEDEPLKQRLLAELDSATPASVPIASSSSGFAPSRLQEMCRVAPQRVLVGHPFNPAYLIPLVEVVPGAATDAAVTAMCLDFYAWLGKRPVHVRHELPGHLANRLQAALWREAYSLVERGVASVADVDAAIAHGPGLRWALLGPLASQHLSGGAGGLAHTLTHLGPPAQAWMDDLGDARLTPELTRLLVDGVDEELRDVDQARLVVQRDELLVRLIQQKARHRALP